MGHVLGLVGSARPWGNSELLVRQVLEGARDEGATVKMVRLTDLRLESCTGCMRCVLGRASVNGDRRCPIDDDLVWLLDTIRAAVGLVVAAPTYFLGPAAVIKLVLDRLLMVVGPSPEDRPLPRPAVTLAAAGLEGWRGVTLPYLNALAYALGFVPIESSTAFAPGPGEILLDERLMGRVLAMGHRLGRGELSPAPAPRNVCPICRCESFSLTRSGTVCPICGLEAEIEESEDGLRLHFSLSTGTGDAEHRWTQDGLRKHMVEWVMATGPRFMAQRHEVRKRRKPFRSSSVGWLCPTPSER